MRSAYASIIWVTAVIALSGTVATSAVAAGDPSGTITAPAAPRKPGDTLKSRLSDKASDEQRVDDCKVPPERRGPKKRPTECGGASSARTSDAQTHGN
ncbi:MAG TPA: hypothetical protein VGD08_21380 [Stellaceae bacterium]